MFSVCGTDINSFIAEKSVHNQWPAKMSSVKHGTRDLHRAHGTRHKCRGIGRDLHSLGRDSAVGPKHIGSRLLSESEAT
ncbi:hypothetical protein AMECASPLE_036345 [Ameca splendens]|uniref:Uncharacterized protein n=1 Tax=Ameca splendens TaxID=208324 RepID=A0ABV0Z6I1_9TELE